MMMLNAARTAGSMKNRKVLVALSALLWCAAQAVLAHAQITLSTPQRQSVAFTSPGLDSLGLGTLGNNVDIAASNARAALFTPSCTLAASPAKSRFRRRLPERAQRAVRLSMQLVTDDSCVLTCW